MLLDDIADYLTSGSSGVLGTQGTSFFKAYMPEGLGDHDECVAVYETGGHAPIQRMGTGPNIAAVERPRVQVVCRAQPFDYQTARDNAHLAFKLLDGMPKRLINGVEYKWVTAIQSPFLIKNKYDTNNRPLVACNYDIMKDVST